MKRRYTFLVLFLVAVLVVSLVRIGDLEQLAGSIGYCVVSDSGDCFLILDTTPVQLYGYEGAFSGLVTGDRLFVIHDGIQSTWPAQTQAHLILKIGSGSPEDIPPIVIDSLTENSWLSE